MFIHHVITLYFLLFPYVIPKDNILISIYLLTLFSLVIHWITNDNTCCLTVTEAYFRKGVPKNELFFQRLVGPVYEPRYDGVIISGMLLLLAISMYRVYQKKDRIEAVFRMLYNDVFGEREKSEEKKEDLN